MIVSHSQTAGNRLGESAEVRPHRITRNTVRLRAPVPPIYATGWPRPPFARDDGDLPFTETNKKRDAGHETVGIRRMRA